jgi:hypothetical protein
VDKKKIFQHTVKSFIFFKPASSFIYNHRKAKRSTGKGFIEMFAKPFLPQSVKNLVLSVF